MAYTIADIEDAIVDALKDSGLADIANTIDSYHGEVEDLVGEVKRLIIPLPAIFVLYGGSQFDETANRSFDDEQTFTIISIAKDLRGRGTSLRTGIYEMIEIQKTTLIDNNLDLDIEPLHPIRIDPLAITKGLSIYGFDLKTSLSL
ncbi:MAG: phage protein Gp37 [Pseudomonadota bacterium]